MLPGDQRGVRALAAALTAFAVLLAGCASPARPTLETTTPTSSVSAGTSLLTSTTTSTSPTSTSTAAESQQQLERRLERICSVGNPEVAGFVGNDDIVEASGIAKASTHDGFWVLNDGADARLFAVGPDGEDRGSVAIAGVQLWDLEDMARWDTGGQTQIVMADIGDNLANRATSHPLVVAVEPQVGAQTANARVVFINYPDGPHNAEALTIDVEANEVVVITKEESPTGGQLPPAQVFAGSLDGADVDGAQIELRLVGTIDIEALRDSSSDTKFHPGELSGVAGLVTSADVSPDGRLVAVRTYGSVWVWARPEGTTVAETLLTPPCEAEPPFELQGEAITFVDNARWATLAEGSFASIRLSPS